MARKAEEGLVVGEECFVDFGEAFGRDAADRGQVGIEEDLLAADSQDQGVEKSGGFHARPNPMAFTVGPACWLRSVSGTKR